MCARVSSPHSTAASVKVKNPSEGTGRQLSETQHRPAEAFWKDAYTLTLHVFTPKKNVYVCCCLHYLQNNRLSRHKLGQTLTKSKHLFQNDVKKKYKQNRKRVFKGLGLMLTLKNEKRTTVETQGDASPYWLPLNSKRKHDAGQESRISMFK